MADAPQRNGLFEPADPARWEPDLSIPSPAEHEELMQDPEARIGRTAERIGGLALPFTPPIRGRRRGEVTAPDQLPLEYPDVVPSQAVGQLDEFLSGSKAPLFDQFSKGRKIMPTKESIDAYCMAWSRKVKSHAGDIRTPAEKRQALMRRTQHIADNLQREILDLRDTARLRLMSIAAVQKAIAHGEDIDERAAIMAADAILDFGHVLAANPEVPKRLHAESLPEQLVFLGEKAATDHGVLIDNVEVLKVIQAEQQKRLNYWAPRYSATKRYLGNRLTNDIKNNAAKNRDEFIRLDAIIRQ